MDKVHENGNVTFTAGGTIAKGELVKFEDGKVVATTAATDAAIGVALDSAVADAIVPVAVLGAFTGTIPLKAAGVIDAGAQVAADGKATTAATDLIVGRALEAATAAGDMIEIAHQVAQVK